MPETSFDTSGVRAEMDQALTQALPQDMADTLSDELEKMVKKLLTQMPPTEVGGTRKTTVTETIDRFGDQAPATDLSNEAPEETSVFVDDAGDENSTTKPTEPASDESPKTTEEPPARAAEPEATLPEETKEEDTGFDTPADPRADMTQAAIPGETTENEEEATDGESKKNPTQKEQRIATAMTQARNNERRKAEAPKNPQEILQQFATKQKSGTTSTIGYPIILMLCFFRDVVAITQLIPVINFVTMQVMAPIFVLILLATALLDRNFFIFLLKELFGIQSKDTGMVKKGAEAAAKKIGMAVWEILLIVLVFIVWPYTLFISHYHGKYLSEKSKKGQQPQNPLTKKPNSTNNNPTAQLGNQSPHTINPS